MDETKMKWHVWVSRILMFQCIDVFTDEVVEESTLFSDCFKPGQRYTIEHRWVQKG